MIKIIESPREAMQGLQKIIPTEAKVQYINALLKVGFDTIETGSYVSPRLIPQMADSLEVLSKIDAEDSKTKIMFLVVNSKGAEKISSESVVTHLSYPFSISPSFLLKNLNTSTKESLITVERISELCRKTNKEPVIYVSMAFGNTFDDAWSLEILEEGVRQIYERGIRIIPLSNVSIEIDAALISKVYNHLLARFPDVEFGLHLHTSNEGFMAKVSAAWDAGVRRFDSVMTGLGGCPLAENELLGNLSTENLLTFTESRKVTNNLNFALLQSSSRLASKIML